jgi:hypothetical protein
LNEPNRVNKKANSQSSDNTNQATRQKQLKKLKSYENDTLNTEISKEPEFQQTKHDKRNFKQKENEERIAAEAYIKVGHWMQIQQTHDISQRTRLDPHPL